MNVYPLPFLSLIFFGYVISIKGGINKVGINIIFLYYSKNYFSFPLVLLGTHNASHGIHFSIKVLMFTLSNFL